MFSFHKPKVYRSAEGCCICGAKSSSSRFTDSSKYEDDSIECFNLETPRRGEICNACVLLVKRFKRLPRGSNRHWGHVVDARTGIKMKKIKRLKEEEQSYHMPEKFTKILKKNKRKNTNSHRWSAPSLPPTPESLDSDEELQKSNIATNVARQRKSSKPRKNINSPHVDDNNSFLDEKIWKRKSSCCGTMYENILLESVVFDIENLVPCDEHKAFFWGNHPAVQNTSTPNYNSRLNRHQTDDNEYVPWDQHKLKSSTIKGIHKLNDTVKSVNRRRINDNYKKTDGTKFNDNSSDSGFDENSRDRKSLSPPGHDETDDVKVEDINKMVLWNGVVLHGNYHNLMATGNEIAAKLLEFKTRRLQEKKEKADRERAEREIAGRNRSARNVGNN